MTRDKMMGRPSRRRNGWSAALLALSGAAAAAGCADHVQSAVVACPCDTGVCCTSGVCAASENACEQATQALSAESAGHWTGYIENETLASGSDALDLTLVTGNDGALSGQMVIGEGTPPAPPTDGNVGWATDHFSSFEFLGLGNIQVMEGFVYHVTNVRWTALRLRFEIDLGEPWAPWCRLQQSYVLRTDPFLASCVPNLGGGSSDGQCMLGDLDHPYVPIDCDKWALCYPNSGACTCTATACDGGSTYGLAFDIALRANEGDGSLRDRVSASTFPIPVILGNHNVRLIRASN